MSEEITPLIRRFIEDAGNLTQSLGSGRVLGQIYAYLYFSQEPKNLGDMQKNLGISKGSASTGVRQLEQWGAVRKVWIMGDRKDYYQANDWFGKILKNAVADIVGRKMSAYSSLLEEIESGLGASGDGEEGEFLNRRIKHLQTFRERAQSLWNNSLVQMLLK